ncbi:RNA polymerase sigma-70 factor [Maribellus comscasis]|uniref:RNA polymerase sigma factor n=1 Tax=Maribellus comscasis TaxID=2681766 RepID=A0A6I6JWT8_9BACT|nr:RNA polymerase sigma-70 factor [Maribellus comscasis]QGY47575.1 RNA polymerase sigma-70 factor [Maribellus comscasis]
MATELNKKLIKLLKKGDITAFDTIYNKYCPKLHQFVFMYLKQDEDAEEIVQEVFLKIWASRAKIDVFSSFESFLFTIAYNETMSLLRKRVSDRKSKEYLKSLQQIDNADQIIDEIQFNELNKRIENLLNQLTPRQKEIYLLSRKDGLTHIEIAQKLHISESTVNNHLVKSLKFLQNHIGSSLTINLLFVCLFLS